MEIFASTSITEISAKIGINSEVLQNAISMAIDVSKLAYAPYSNFPVGCALITQNHTHQVKSCNVENASYGLTMCAERNVIGKAISEGVKGPEIDLIVVYAEKGWGMPCGACRQVMFEMNPNMWVLIVPPEGSSEYRYTKIEELLPGAFNL